MAETATVKASSQTESVSERIVTAVAEFTGSDPLSLDPLYEAIDPDALDALFATDTPAGTPRRVAFTYAGCDVEITGDGNVRVSDAVPEPAPESQGSTIE